MHFWRPSGIYSLGSQTAIAVADASHSFITASFSCQLKTMCSKSLCPSITLIALLSREFFQSLLQSKVAMLKYIRAFCVKYDMNKEQKANASFGNLTLPGDTREREIEKKQKSPQQT